MTLNVSSESLRSILKLAEKRESLAAELARIEGQIAQALGGVPDITKAGHDTGHGRKVKRATGRKRGKRGAVKEAILAGLREAGKAGIAVKHLASKLAIKPQNIHVCFTQLARRAV